MVYEDSSALEAEDKDLLEELQDLRRRNAELELLYDTIQELNSTLSVPEVLDRLLSRALLHLDSEIGSILLRDGNDVLRIVVSQGLPESVVGETCLRPSQGISGIVVETGKPLLVTDIESEPRFRRRNHERYYTRSFISAPLRYMGQVWGVVNINNKRSRDVFSNADLRWLEALAGHASAALANAHRYEEMLERAQRDSLTGLANHGHMTATLDIEFKRAGRHGRPLSLMILDVDHFKAFNDRFGHMAGDDALRTVARRLESNSRAHDVVARYGGEEFAVILPETSLEGATCFAEKIRISIARGSFGPEGRDRLTISAGVAVSDESMQTYEDLLSLADQRLYRAKESGRDRVCSR